MSDIPEVLPGGCLCGRIRYRAYRPVSEGALCHCISCRRASGAPVVAWFTVRAEDLDFDEGAPTEFRSSEHVVRGFCGDCGTPLTYRHEQHGDYVDVTTASLDDPESMPPADHIWTSDRLRWMADLDRLPEYARTRKE
jgi:hypothetical protein